MYRVWVDAVPLGPNSKVMIDEVLGNEEKDEKGFIDREQNETSEKYTSSRHMAALRKLAYWKYVGGRYRYPGPGNIVRIPH